MRSRLPRTTLSSSLIDSSTHPLVVVAGSGADHHHADFCEDPDGQDHHARGRVLRHHRQCENQNSRQGGHSSRPAAPHLRRQTARGWPHLGRLQHPEGVHFALGAASPRWYYRTLAHGFGPEVQPGEDDLQEVLRSSPPSCCELPQEEVRTHQPASPKEEDQVDGRVFAGVHVSRLCCMSV